MERLDQRNAIINAQVRQLNDRICQLAGLSEPVCRADQQRVYYNSNMLFFDEAKAGMSRAAALQALQAEGVSVGAGDYPENHKYAVYSEPQWWHHPPVIPTSMPGNDFINNQHIFLPLFYGEADDVIDQYVKAFQKIWAHRSQLASS